MIQIEAIHSPSTEFGSCSKILAVSSRTVGKHVSENSRGNGLLVKANGTQCGTEIFSTPFLA
jgi:hypothetical protein